MASIHREENIFTKSNIEKIILFLDKIASKYQKKIILSLHPRLKIALNKNKLKFSKNIIIQKPFGFIDYINLQKNSFFVLSDSGSITEESNIYGFRAINLRNSNERQEGMEEAAVPMCHFDVETAYKIIDFYKNNIELPSIISDYSSADFSDKIIKILLSYTNNLKNKYKN